MSCFYQRDRILNDNLWIALGDLLNLEETSRGEPRHYAYEHALLSLNDLITALRDELRQAARNPYYQQKKGEDHAAELVEPLACAL